MSTPHELEPFAPPPSQRFAPVEDARGLRLAIVFGNEAAAGVCPYARAGRCHHCDIGLGEGSAATEASNLARLAWFASHYAGVWPDLRHLVLYCSGSVLNGRELSPRVLGEALRLAAGLPRLVAASLDSRESYVTRERALSCAETLGPGRELLVILGVESGDDAVRDGHLEKRMPWSAIERAADALADAQAAPHAERRARLGLSANVVVGAPGTTPATRVADARGTARRLLALAEPRGLPLDLNIHPYYRSMRGAQRFPDHPRTPPEAVREALAAIEEEVGTRARVFLGLQDEGHDQEPEARRAALDELGFRTK